MKRLLREKPGKLWGVCPHCSANLRPGIRIRPPYLNCPFCGVPIMPIWWQRIPWVILGFVLAFGFPALVGFRGWDAFFLGLFLLFPATVFAYMIVFTTVPPKYVRRHETTTTLFGG
jgi:hypothetical protein